MTTFDVPQPMQAAGSRPAPLAQPLQDSAIRVGDRPDAAPRRNESPLLPVEATAWPRVFPSL